MESDNRKLSLLSFLILSGVSAYVFYLILTEVSNWLKFGGSNVLFGQPWPIVGGTAAVIAGIVMFAALVSNSKALDFTDDVFAEVKKTTWPTAKETAASTVVVTIMVLIAGLMFLVMDLVWKSVFDFLL